MKRVLCFEKRSLQCKGQGQGEDGGDCKDGQVFVYLLFPLYLLDAGSSTESACVRKVGGWCCSVVGKWQYVSRV